MEVVGMLSRAEHTRLWILTDGGRHVEVDLCALLPAIRDQLCHRARALLGRVVSFFHDDTLISLRALRAEEPVVWSLTLIGPQRRTLSSLGPTEDSLPCVPTPSCNTRVS